MRRLKLALIPIVAQGLLLAQPKTQTNSVGIELVLIPAGEFTMGRFAPVCAPVGLQGNVTESQHDECLKLAKEATRPGFSATIAKPFYMGKYEITQEQYQKVMGRNPSYHTSDKVGEASAKYPVDSIAWNDARQFITKLNALEKTKAYRLPSEAEWEYAARAGTTDETQGAKRSDVAWYMSNARYVTHPVGLKNPNPWGLYDMLGNVWEWVQDFYDEQVQPSGPKGPPTGSQHVLRGGGYAAHEKNVRVSVHAGGPGSPIAVGFRVVRDIQ